MSRTKKGKKAVGFDYWSKRPTKSTNPGRTAKKSTHKKERAASKKTVRKERMTADQILTRLNAAVAANAIEFAPQDKLRFADKSLVTELMLKCCDLEPGDYYVSDESMLIDMGDGREIVKRGKEAFGVDLKPWLRKPLPQVIHFLAKERGKNAISHSNRTGSKNVDAGGLKPANRKPRKPKSGGKKAPVVLVEDETPPESAA